MAASSREYGAAAWATCPLTENGFLRTIDAVRKTDFVLLPHLIDYLRAFQSSGGHHRWNDDFTLLDERLFDANAIHGRRRLTDVYLLGLAVKDGGRLVTFDSRLRLPRQRARATRIWSSPHRPNTEVARTPTGMP